MPKVVKLKLEPLTQESFAPYGQAIASVEEARPVVVKGGLKSKEFTVEAGDNRRSYFNYHTDAGQAYYPSRHGPIVFMVGRIGAPPPSPEELRAFHSDGSTGICFYSGVWHAVPIPLERDELIKSVRGGQDFATHNVDFDYGKEMGLVFEPDLADIPW